MERNVSLGWVRRGRIGAGFGGAASGIVGPVSSAGRATHGRQALPARASHRPLRWALGLVVAWLALRLALLATGAELGEARTLALGPNRVAVLLFQGRTPATTLLVVTHGGLASKESVLAVCWEARRRGADCVAVDALGHGASSAQPPNDTVAAMRAALAVGPLLGSYRTVRFLGHSMGAVLGRGQRYACAQSVALGQETQCADDRVVWGTLHRTLGLSQQWYLLAHVLESWTPWVIERALDRVLPKATPGPLPVQIALSWSSLALATAAGVALAAAFRRRCAWSPALRGLTAGAIVWAALDLGAWRTLWFLTPTQASDLLVVGMTCLACLILAMLVRLTGMRRALLGNCLASLVALAVAAGLFLTFRTRALGGLLVLLPLMTIPLVPWVWLWERCSRSPRSDVVESAMFTSTLLACFVALLLPGFG